MAVEKVKTLTDVGVKALKAADPGKRYIHKDTEVPGLGISVTDKGTKTFVLVARFPGSSNPTRRAIGEYGAIKLETARTVARDWKSLVRQGIDPKELETKRRLEEQQKRDNSFGMIVEEYIRLKVVGDDELKPKQRKGLAVARELRDEFVNDVRDGDRIVRHGLRDRPIVDITRADITRVVDDAVARGATYQAHNLLGHARTFFNWAIGRGVYGIESSPCDRMKPKSVIGKKALRKRVLNDTEIAALWRASSRAGYPYGKCFQMLLLTGQRKSEVAEARWREFDLKKKIWTIPPARMKAENSHVVPLSDEVIAILETLPKFKKADHLFTTTGGVKPINGFSKSKARLDKLMTKYLRAYARLMGSDPDGVELPSFVIHDIRRTMRTGLSSLPGVSSIVAELVIAHTQKGLHAVYDQHSYLDEKRNALDLWAKRITEITRPAPDNVVQFNRKPA
ncbi:tyrosine-type recombinase/integrase [Phyllobacterium sp. 22552]|uniref:tyrosine-type recombinase/integrase n=1 Tax=Phyllobacterium sp. 22552 TaxID=3453941 RepID=UPI003F87DC33